MRIPTTLAAMAAVMLVPAVSHAQSRGGLGDMLTGLAREAVARRPDSSAAPTPAGARDAGARQDVARMDHTAVPRDGSARRSAGFTPWPLTVETTSGGPVNVAPLLGGACGGLISTAPNYAFTYTAGSAPLYILVRSQADTTLVVRNPDGSFGCSDDYNGLNPALRWDAPASGTYHIWVGAIGPGAPATISITERQ